MRKLDLNSWERSSHYQFYTQFKDPIFSLTGNVNVEILKNYCELNNLNFYAAYLFLSQKVASKIREFRLRIVDGELIEYDKLSAGPTVLRPDNTFRFSYIPACKDFKSFSAIVQQSREKALTQDVLTIEHDEPNMIYYTVIPWISFTALKNPNMQMDTSVPKIAFGKYFEEGDHLKMPVCIEAHHGLMDGYHVGVYFEKFQKALNNPYKHFKIIDPYKIINQNYRKKSIVYHKLVTHSKIVAKRALSIASEHPELKANKEFLEEAALLHDIGINLTHAPNLGCYGKEEYIAHGHLGANLLRSLGYPKHAKVCERHTGTGLTKSEIKIRKIPIPINDYMPLSIEEKIICYADKFYSKGNLDKVQSIENVRLRMEKYGKAKAKTFSRWAIKFE